MAKIVGTVVAASLIGGAGAPQSEIHRTILDNPGPGAAVRMYEHCAALLRADGATGSGSQTADLIALALESGRRDGTRPSRAEIARDVDTLVPHYTARLATGDAAIIADRTFCQSLWFERKTSR
jgi:hypothetical protein